MIKITWENWREAVCFDLLNFPGKAAADVTMVDTHSFTSSKLDSCNSILYGLPATHLDKLQRIQNAAARLVSRRKKYEHITPVLHDLHWLNVKNRITFKILLITFKALHGQAPIYINELLNIYRSAGRNLLQVSTFYTKTYGDRAFSVAAAKLWNSLPDAMRIIESLDIFKTNLKTFLFNL